MFVFLPPISVKFIIFDALTILLIVILADIIMSNLVAFKVKMGKMYRTLRALRSITDPMCNPIRRMLPSPSRMGNLDFAPMILMMIIQAVRNALL